jgi:ubiquinone/menaquinone biosynthesis C-methylase UbiE
MSSQNPADLKRAVAEHWSAEPCGTRGVDASDRRNFFAGLEAERAELEPFIPDFAKFRDAGGLRVLEVGVGPGNDFVNWPRHGAIATGVDLTEAGVALTRERLALEGLQADVVQADAERLPFPDATFDLVYSYGVLHHTPDTARAVAEVWRVLKPGGTARLMLYHHPSWTGLLLWGVHCLGKGKPWVGVRSAVYQHLESPGTKSYTFKELDVLLGQFEHRRYRVELLGGDLLSFRRSAKYQARWHELAWRLYPRGIIQRFGRSLGLAVLIEARR